MRMLRNLIFIFLLAFLCLVTPGWSALGQDADATDATMEASDVAADGSTAEADGSTAADDEADADADDTGAQEDTEADGDEDKTETEADGKEAGSAEERAAAAGIVVGEDEGAESARAWGATSEPSLPLFPSPMMAPRKDAGPLGWLGLRGSVHGYLRTRYEFRRAEEEDAEDQDVFQYLGLDVGDPVADPYTLHMLARGSADIDGQRGGDEYFIFDSIRDDSDRAVQGRLYYLYADINDVPETELLRIGRQTIHETPVTMYVDGARFESDEWSPIRLQVGVYGGVPVHLYEASPEDDALVGGFLRIKPWRGGRIRLDAAYIEDAYRLGEEQNDYQAVEVQQTLPAGVRLVGRYSRLEDESHDAKAQVFWVRPKSDLQMRLSYHHQFETKRNFVTEFDPYFLSLQEFHPYHQVRAILHKGFGPHLSINLGYDQRWLEDEEDEGPLNHEFARYSTTLTVRDVAVKGLSLSVTGEQWNSHDPDNGYQRWISGEIAYQQSRRLLVAVGSSYNRYEYDFLAGVEREDVRSYYLKTRWNVQKRLRLEASYALEQDDLDDYHVLRLGLKHSF